MVLEEWKKIGWSTGTMGDEEWGDWHIVYGDGMGMKSLLDTKRRCWIELRET
jgi:hypothetical protein